MPEGEIIVIANPEETTTGGYAAIAIAAGGSGPGGGGANRQLRDNEAAAANSVKIEDDVNDDEVVVIANSMKRGAVNIYHQLTPPRDFNLPCVGIVSSATLRNIALGLQFRVTNKDFGEGRAGENHAKSNKPVYVDINKDAFKGYAKLSGGLNYLTLHEIAHSLKQMRDFNKSQFDTYSNGAGKGLSYDERKANFPKSPEFAENEARANAIARAIAQAMNGISMLENPKHGFETSC